ncbi:cytochrome P450 [Camillea tinctor]|nr:cytochrome P450 [Camillea tinctor]
MALPIPGPWPLPILGNIWNVDAENSVRDLSNLADVYGPIYKLRIGGEDRIIVTSQELVNEVCSRKEFAKYPVGFVMQLREVAPEGLFAAYPDQGSWGIAHRTLMPTFGSTSIKNMFPEMMDTSSQLLLKWARFGPDHPINVVDDFTRLTLDTVTLCAMDTRLNSFYTDEVRPEVKAMVGLLYETQQRTYRPWWITALMRGRNRKFDDDNNLIHEFAAKVIANRRANPSNRKDLVDAMLNGRDPKTGKQLTDDMIIDNMITFLIAGHETTAGLLSFMMALLLTHREAYSKLQAEIDSVVGTNAITVEHLKDLKYLKACLWETLRIHPPSGLFPVTYLDENPNARTTLGKQWEVKSGQTIIIVVPKLHRDPEIWGDDVEEFKPERMMEENFKKIPKNAFKPFGNGSRACIGRSFALQEATLAIALLFQNLDFKLADPDYKITIKQNLANKPHNYFIYAKPRPHVNLLTLQHDLFSVRRDTASSTDSDEEKQD